LVIRVKLLAKIKDADPYSSIMEVELVKTKERGQLVLKDRELAKIATALKNRVVDIVVEGNVVTDIAASVQTTVYGVKYSEIKDLLPEGTKRLGLAHLIGDFAAPDVGEVMIIILVIALISIIIYLAVILPIVYIIASLITLGEVWRMRHKTYLLVPISLSTIPNIRKMASAVVAKKGSLRGLHDLLLDENIARMNRKLRTAFILLDLGKYLIGFTILGIGILYAIYIVGEGTLSGFWGYIASTGLWQLPAIVAGLGFALIVIAGIYHRRISLSNE